MTINVIRPRDSSFTSNQFFVLILLGWFGVNSNKFIIIWYSNIILLYIYICVCVYIYIYKYLSLNYFPVNFLLFFKTFGIFWYYSEFINNFLSFFCRYTSFFKCFFIVFISTWLWFLKKFCHFFSHFISS